MMPVELLNVDRQHEPGLGWMPLVVQGILANSNEDITRNLEYSLSQDYIPFNKLMNTKSGAVAIVCSGPSLKDTWPMLRDFDGDIVACNASFKFLLDKGITPDYMFCFDADPMVKAFFVPHPDVTYLICSRCPPVAFEMLKGCRIVVWHAAGDKNLEKLLIERGKGGGSPDIEPMMIGGSAAITRGMCVLLPMGYTAIHFFGADSSFANGDTHIKQSLTTERRMAVRCNGRVFEVAPWMTIQTEDLKAFAPGFLAMGIKLFFHGDGLMQHIAREYGCRTDYETETQQWLREFKRDWKRKATILWQHV